MGYQQVTLAQFRARLLERLGQPGATFYTTAELNIYINESLRVWNSLTGYWRGTQILTTTTGPWYVINGTLFSSMRVTWQGKPLSPVSLFDLDSGRENWQSENIGSGGSVPIEPQLYGVGACNLIAIWPADTATTNELMVDGVLSTPVLASDSDFINVGEEEFSLLLDYCEHTALFKEGGQEWEISLPLFQNFVQGAVKRNGIMSKSSLYRKYLGGDEGDLEKNPEIRYARVGVR